MSTMLFPLLRRTDTAGKFRRRQLDQNGILSDALNASPWDHQIVLPSKTEDAVTSANDDRKDTGILLVKLKIGSIPKARAVAQIDDLQPSKIHSATPLHKHTLLSP